MSSRNRAWRHEKYGGNIRQERGEHYIDYVHVKRSISAGRLVYPKKLIYDIALLNDRTSHSAICEVIIHQYPKMGGRALALVDSSPIPEESTFVIHNVFCWNVQRCSSSFEPRPADYSGKRCLGAIREREKSSNTSKGHTCLGSSMMSSHWNLWMMNLYVKSKFVHWNPLLDMYWEKMQIYGKQWIIWTVPRWFLQMQFFIMILSLLWREFVHTKDGRSLQRDSRYHHSILLLL